MHQTTSTESQLAAQPPDHSATETEPQDRQEPPNRGYKISPLQIELEEWKLVGKRFIGEDEADDETVSCYCVIYFSQNSQNFLPSYDCPEDAVDRQHH